jgi:hypothetical protein
VRRQTLRRTRSELHRSLDETDREVVMESWSATERVFRELRSLSPLTTLLGRAFAAGYAESKRLRGEGVPLTFFAVMLAGYATRSLFVDIIGQPLLDPHTPPLDQLVGRDYDYEDPDTNVAAIELLRDPVFQLVFADFGTVMTLSPELWAGYISLATMQLQANLKSRAVPARYLDRECIEGMLRYGYVLRCVDEALGAEPDPRSALGRSARARTRWGVLTDCPLSAHSDDELADGHGRERGSSGSGSATSTWRSTANSSVVRPCCSASPGAGGVPWKWISRRQWHGSAASSGWRSLSCSTMPGIASALNGAPSLRSWRMPRITVFSSDLITEIPHLGWV